MTRAAADDDDGDMNSTTLSDLWATRPRRRRTGRKVAGICAGFGARYNVDPTLVRVAFVVAAIFGGSGILLYLVAMFVLPSGRRGAGELRRGPESPAAADSGMNWTKIVLLAVLAVVVVSNLGDDRWWSSGGVLGTALMLIGWWLLYQRTPIAPEGTGADSLPASDSSAAADDPLTGTAAPTGMPIPPQGYAETPVPGPSVPTDQDDPAAPPTPEPAVDHDANAQATTVTTPSAPPRWDPLGVAPFAWDLPEPPVAPAGAPVKAPKSPITPIVTGLAILAAVAGTLAHLLGAEWFTVGRIASLALIVVAIGMLVAALQRRPEGGHADGLIPLGLLIGAIVVVSTLMTATHWSVPQGGVGERKYQITEQSQLRDQYSLTVGSTKLDLRQLNSLTHDQTITIDQGVGEIKVALPPNVRVKANCNASVGDFTCPPGIVGGADDGPVLTIDAQVGLGNVEMTR